MELIFERKLKSNNPVTISQVFSGLLKSLLKNAQNEGPNTNLKELLFLKEKCIDNAYVIRQAALETLIHLIDNEILEIKPTLSDFIAMIPGSKCLDGLATVIGALLNYDIRKHVDNDENADYSPYNLHYPQHPFVLILIEDANAYKYVYNEIKYLYSNAKDLKNISQMLRPVNIFSICDPVNPSTVMKKILWTFLLGSGKSTDIVFDILCWIQVKSCRTLDTNAELIIEALQSNIFTQEQTEILILWLSSILYQLTLGQNDVREVIYEIKSTINRQNKLVTVNVILLVLSKTIYKSCATVLTDILEICEDLITKHENVENIVLNSIKAVLLQWIANPCVLTEGVNKYCKKLLIEIENKLNTSPNQLNETSLKILYTKFSNIIRTNSEIDLNINAFLKCPSLEVFITNLTQAPVTLLKDLFHLLCGVFISNCNSVKIKCLDLILKCVQNSNELSVITTILLLYELSNTTHAQLHFNILRAFPLMVVSPENQARVIATIQAISKGSKELFEFCLKLMFEVWRIDNKCYTYLESMLLETLEYNKIYEREALEWNVARVVVFRELCEQRPELYGKDMVGHLSKVLNDCNDLNGSIPCAIALESIKILCRAEIIDVLTTWTSLAPKFKNDTRPVVLKSLCQLLGEIPLIHYTEAYTELTTEVVKTLWKFVVDYNSVEEVLLEAFGALGNFKMEDICCNMPKDYLLDEKDREAAATGKPIGLVSGDTWVNFLLIFKSSKASRKFMNNLIAKEISEYLKYVYSVKGHREPLNYDYLPRHSIVRGVCNYLKKYFSKISDIKSMKNSEKFRVFTDCLYLLSQEYSKPLPPQDWTFLEELVNEPEVRGYVIDVAAHQVILSGSARRFIENFIASTKDNLAVNDILLIYRNLKYLANSLQPGILRPFFENTLHFAMQPNEECPQILDIVLNYLGETLKNDDVQAINKNTIGQVFKEIIFILDHNSEILDLIINCAALLPQNILEELTKYQEPFDGSTFNKMVKFRCTLAIESKDPNALNWINPIIENTATAQYVHSVYTDLMRVFESKSTNTESAVWLLELFGQIQTKVAERCDFNDIRGLFDVLMLAIVTFGGYNVFFDHKTANIQVIEIQKQFPQALNSLLQTDYWSICTIQVVCYFY